MSLQFEIEVVQSQYELTQDGSEVQFHFSNCPEVLTHHLKAVPFKETFPPLIIQSYTIKQSLGLWKFSHKEVLSDIDHKPLLDFLTKFIDTFVVYRVKYVVPELQKPVEALLHQLDELKEITAFEIMKEDKSKELTMLISKQSQDLVRARFQKLRDYKMEQLVFPMEEYLQKRKLKVDECTPFLRGLLNYFKNSIKHYTGKKMKKMHLHNDISIQNIKCLEEELKRKISIKHGLLFTVIGFGERFGKLYQFVEKWIEKLNWVVLEVPQIECCKRDKIEDWLYQHKKEQAVLLSPKAKHGQVERVVVFEPEDEKDNLQRELVTATRLITGRQFCLQNSKGEDRFYLLFKYQSDFKKFVMGERGGQSNFKMAIYPQYLLARTDKYGEMGLRRKIAQFLQLYQEEEVRIEEFKSMFHIQIFKHYYSSKIRTKPIKIELIDGRLYRCNSKQKSEQIENQIKDIYKTMRKELLYKPISKRLSNRHEDVSVGLAPPEWMTVECLESRRYAIGDKLTIYLRSYGSIVNSDSSCIFLVQDMRDSRELGEILKEEEASSMFQAVLQKNKKMELPLRYYRYFQNITIWLFQKEKYRQRRNSNNAKRLKSEVQALLDATPNPHHVYLMLSAHSDSDLLAIFLPVLLETLVESCRFDASKTKKELTIYTSCDGGEHLRKGVIEQLRRFFHHEKVDRVTDLDLRLPDLQKIVEYKYLELKYFQDNQTKCTTPLNSFVFSRELLKKGRTPLFLPLDAEKKSREYLVSYFSSDVWEIQGGQIMKLKVQVREVEELSVLVDLVKTYFPMLDYLVLFGNIEKRVFSERLVYTESKESMYKVFEELRVDCREKKILMKNNDVRLKYQLVYNEFLELYRVETHPSKVPQLQNLKKYVLL